MTTNYFLLATMSRLVSSLMLLSLMVMVVNAMPDKSCGPDGKGTKIMVLGKTECVMPGDPLKDGKREALDDPMANTTMRGEYGNRICQVVPAKATFGKITM